MASHHRGRIPSYLATAAALLLAFLLPPLAASQWQNCGKNGNFAKNSTYQANIQALSTTLPKNASSAWTLFAFASVGTVPDIVYALALCRGDANDSACGTCVSNGFKDAQQLCPYSKAAAVYYDLCYLGFSNQNILSATDGDNTALILLNDNNVTVPVKVFDAAVGVLMNATADYAATASSRRFGAGEEGFETIDKAKPKIYGLAQCRPDMSPADCRSCLANIITHIPQYLTGRQGGRVLGLQCNFRYEQFPFFTGPSLLQLPAPSLGAVPAPAPANVTRPPVGGGDIPGSKRGRTKVLLIALTSAAAALLFPCVYVLIWYMTGKRNWFLLWKKNSSSTERHYEAMIALYGPLAPKRYMYSEVIKITSSRNKKLGQGGYGVVFEGKLHDGRLVAAKFLHDCKGNGEEFVNEVMSIGRTSHVNIVSLFGFCLEGSKRALIYEYMCNGSLDRYIYSENPKEILGWERLYAIAIGIARGLEYLHHGCNTRIVHFDVKPQNILLDKDFCPKIADFGLAKLCRTKESKLSMVGARGTIGFIAPEVHSRNFGVVSTKSDVYSYGMMLLEMVGGRKNVKSMAEKSSEKYFPDWIYDHFAQDDGLEACEVTSDIEEIARKMTLIGLWCIQVLPVYRPTITKVLEMFERSLDDMAMPPKQNFSELLENSAHNMNVQSASSTRSEEIRHVNSGNTQQLPPL